MRIGIDARLYGPKHTGIGRYTQNLLHELIRISPNDEFVVFGDPGKLLELAQYPNVNIEKLTTKIYSVAEQIINPLTFSKFKLDLLHVPHINAPIFYRGKMVITVHDLIKHLSVGKETSTLPGWQYRFKHLAYKLVVSKNLKKAAAICTPSYYWKEFLIQRFNVNPDKIFVTYEAVSQNLQPVKLKLFTKGILSSYQLKKPFLIYTGNLYPHKNVPFLINALKKFNETHTTKINLALIGSRDAFKAKFNESEHLKILGYVPDKDLPSLYPHALALVQPSLIEGFGLTGLEAMRLKLPVLSSNSTCLPEIYQEAALYFDPYDEDDLILKLTWLLKEPELRNRLIKRGQERADDFSWRQTAKDTLKSYTHAR